MKVKIYERFDFFIILAVLVLSVLGVLFIYSSGIDSSGLLKNKDYYKQIVWCIVGFVLMLSCTFIDYRKLKRYTGYAAILLTLALIYTAFFGQKLNGARSWIGIGSLGIQPSEFGKLVFTLFLARYLEKSEQENPRKRFLLSLVILLTPMGLILLQPDLGTASAYLPIFLVMCFIANIPIRYIVLVLATGMLTILFTVLPIWESQIAKRTVLIISVLTNRKLFIVVCAVTLIVAMMGILGQIFLKKKYFYWVTYVSGILFTALILSVMAGKVLQEYQIMRLIIFINPNIDPKGAGWNIINSQIAIGSGGTFGKGYLMGTQSHYRYLPQQSTDFIFSILAEEFGFAGGIAVFASFLVIMLRGLSVIRTTTSHFGAYISSGFLGMFFYHFLVNVGMVMGIMPITGIPLPFVSYGGSAYLTNSIAMGLIMSIRARRLDFDAVV
ncbi:MAG TPA: rod shape-determining protein RodA [Treponema sp.]|jgi:rod shape determining protein RodA|nr:rod shape-determining protein RodA [Treponema sp.]HAK68939.1 rod shape-determining protein RodA [Treponema sp.]HCA19490.1 rod shape-determining protein RodA [Treponema sp.]